MAVDPWKLDVAARNPMARRSAGSAWELTLMLWATCSGTILASVVQELGIAKPGARLA